MRVVDFILALLLAAAIGRPAEAAPITYTVTGTLTGTLGDDGGTVGGAVGQSFTDAAFVWQVTGDTAQAVTVDTHGGLVTEVAASTDTIAIGATVLRPTIPTFLAVVSVPSPPDGSAPVAVAGFVDQTALLGLAWRSPSLFEYDGVSGIGPLAVAFDNAGPLPTDAGPLAISTASGLTFRADVDEPPGVTSFLVGLAACAAVVGVGARRRTGVAPD